MRCMSLLAGTLLCALFVSAQEIPVGTVVPVMITVTLDSARAHVGQPIAGRVMERVPLPGGEDIPEGAKVVGHVSVVIPAKAEAPASLAVQFDKVVVHGHDLPMQADLRALASMMAVYDAQVPFFEPDTTPRGAVMLAPVGGEAAFRPDNPEKSYRPVHFSGELAPGCGGRVDQDGGTGALWVFSPYACGVYGFGSGVVIVRQGSAATGGSILLGSKKNFSIHAGSGWLLRVTPQFSNADAVAQGRLEIPKSAR
jgi:hypothetical protein